VSSGEVECDQCLHDGIVIHSIGHEDLMQGLEQTETGLSESRSIVMNACTDVTATTCNKRLGVTGGM
jgi:hypothetical protein